MNVMRLAIGLPLAAGITAGLFFLMRTLITVDAIPVEAATDYEFDIFEEVTLVEPDTGPDMTDITQVNPPPPVPVLPTDPASLPDGDLIDFVGTLPTLDPPVINSGGTIFVADVDARPLVRIEPIYPNPAAQRGLEGRCLMIFDIAADGTPSNVRADCTNSIFAGASIRAVERWRYNPAIENGAPQVRRNVNTTLNFRLND